MVAVAPLPDCGGYLWFVFQPDSRFLRTYRPATGTDEKFVRSHKTNLFDRMFFYTLNFNYHVEHHLYPQLPCCHLPKLQHAMTEAGKAPLISPSIFSTIKERLAQCPR